MRKRFLTTLLSAVCSAMIAMADTCPIQLTNNSVYDDSEIYVAIIGQYNGTWIYYDLANNSSTNAALVNLTTAVNTLHKTSGDWGYANIFTTLDKIKNKTIYADHTNACRIFFGFRSPMYLHAFDNAGYAGADFQNSEDPNHGIRWENMEFTYDQYDVMFINTTRVDAFQYPMGVELFGTANSNNAYMKRGELLNYATIINRWNTTNANNDFKYCYQDVITTDALGGIITQPSKVAEVKNNGFFDDYINRIWNYFSSNELYADMGLRGKWRGKVNGGNSFVMTNVDDANLVATINKPTTTDVIEGAGTFATGSETDKAVQAQFCGAMNRGVIDLTVPSGEMQNWGATEKFFKTDTYNPYVQFFHQSDISYDGYTYAFAYDDTFDQSSTCATKYPDHVVITIGGFASNPGEMIDPGQQGGDDPQTPSSESGNGTTANGGVNYTYSFTQSGKNVTVTFNATNASEIVGIVNPYIWDYTDGFAETSGNTKTWENVDEGTVLKVKCMWPCAAGQAITDEVTYTVKAATSTDPETPDPQPTFTLTAAPVPTKAAANVKSIYSNAYTPVTSIATPIRLLLHTISANGAKAQL